MKSISMDDHGSSRLNCVCKCRNGLVNDVRPAIHIFAGENVCIHKISPMQRSELLASRHSPRTSSGVVSTGLKTTLKGIAVSSFNDAAIVCECLATCASASAPYK